MDDQNSPATPAEGKSAAEKKAWITPALEIIDTDEIESGSYTRNEGTTFAHEFFYHS
jgi:hypothetical protein